MGFVKCILCKIDHFVINLICDFLINSVLNTSRNTFRFISVNKSLSLFFHDLQFLLGHGTAEKVTSSQGKSGKALYNLHNLLLVHNTSVGGLQNWLQLRTVVVDGVRTVFATDVLGDKVHRSRAVQGNSGDYILQAVWFQLFHEALHSTALQLKNTICTAGSKGIQHFLVVVIYFLHIKREAVVFLYIFYCIIDNCKSSKTKEIHFQKSQFFQGSHDKLSDNSSVLCTGKRHIFGDILLADYYTCGMHGRVPRKTFQALRHINQMVDVRLLIVCFFQLRIHFHGFVDGDNLHIRNLGWNHFGNGIHLCIRHIKDTAYITDNTAGCQGTKGNDLNHTVFTIFAHNIIDYFLSSLKSKIHVNIRHGYSLRVQETFKQKVVFNWIK